MKVLWLCNIMLPKIAEHLHKEVNHKEGWLSGIYDRLSQSNFLLENGEKLELGVCFSVNNEAETAEIQLGDMTAFAFYEDISHPEIYEEKLEESLGAIVQKFQPDLVHCFGTEYPHTLAMTRAFPYPEKILVGIQGLCGECAEVYMASLPEKVQNARTFRDILKRDSLKEQKEKFAKRGENERKALKNVGHITGRTDWDYGCTNKVSKARYHFMNETLRSVFYEGNWEYEKCIPHSIFLSQGDYPLKGLHFVLEAMPLILEKYPDTTLLIAGNDLTKSKTLMEKIKISAYGKYLRKLICEKRLQDKVHFLGRLTAAQMKQQFLESNLYLCSSILENSPNSLGEAMLLGVPSIAADTGGIPSVFTDKKDGLLFERGNVKALANCVIEMFNDSKMQQVYSENAKRHARKTHDPDTNYHRLLEIYGEIVCK